MNKIHPNAPPRLVKAYRKAGSFHKLADEIGVNPKYVHELITKGIEPTDRTEHGRETRARLFLPKRKRKRYADCKWCGKLVEVADNGSLHSHSHPDGTYCRGSDKRDFLPSFKPAPRRSKRQPRPEHRRWWQSIGPDGRELIIKQMHDLNKDRMP